MKDGNKNSNGKLATLSLNLEELKEEIKILNELIEMSESIVRFW